MKRIGNLFDTVFSRENLYQAYLDARSGKRKKKACFLFDTHLGQNLSDLYCEIHDGSYAPQPYHSFTVYEPKTRTIHAPHFRDIVVQHAIYRVIYDIFDKTFIASSFACRKGGGTHRASAYAQAALRSCHVDDYYLKLDIRKFFASIDRTILQDLIEKKLKDSKLIDIMMMFARLDTAVGIPIGNLLSQLYALIYLNPLDHFVKRILRIRHYVRYVDDFVLLGLSRQACVEHKERIVDFIVRSLRLGLSRHTIQKIGRGINFVGYRTYRAYRLIRKYSLHKFSRMLARRRIAPIVSLLGHAKATLSLRSMIKYIQEAAYAKDLQLPENYRRLYDPAPG